MPLVPPRPKLAAIQLESALTKLPQASICSPRPSESRKRAVSDITGGTVLDVMRQLFDYGSSAETTSTKTRSPHGSVRAFVLRVHQSIAAAR